jgi:predicted phosphoadenosine phosphosulfate sulfurtransferase
MAEREVPIGGLKPAVVWWGKQSEGRNVWEAALDRVRYTYDNFDDVFVSFSGGKDSTCVLHAVLDVAHERGALPVRVVHIDEEGQANETSEYVRRVANRDDIDLEWYCVPIVYRNGTSSEAPVWSPWAPEDRAKWVREPPADAITEIDGYDPTNPEDRLTIPDLMEHFIVKNRRRTAACMGIRANESMTRRMAVSQKRADNWIVPSPRNPFYWKSYPVYDWTIEDVWTAPASMGWDYNRAYDLMEMAGIPHSSQRCATPFGDEPMQNLWMWAQCFPDIWERLCERVPGASTGARYARTELYSFAEVTPPPEGVTWQEYIRERLEEHEPDVRAYTARQIEDLIRLHYSKTAEPIMPTAPHPLSGISWKKLYTFADRTDMKSRRSVMVLADGQGTPEQRARYEAERAKYA